MATLASLPPEISREILSYLPISTLLDFGLTSKYYHALQSCSLSTLRLGVFHSRLSGMVSLMEATADRSCLHSVNIVLPKHECRTKDKVICNQNSRAREIVVKYQHTLRSFEIALWELQEISANSIAQLRNLQKLSVRLDHPYTRHPGIEHKFWDTSPASTVWNILASKPGKTTALGRLRSLNLERAGITDYQLARIVESNPKLTELRLSRCFNLTTKTFKFLAESAVGRQLEVLHFTKCASNQIDDSILGYIKRLPNLKTLSLYGCHNLDSDFVQKLNDRKWHIPDLVVPNISNGPREGVEIDEEYK